MLVVRSPRLAAIRIPGVALALSLVLAGGVGAAESRLARPVTDAPAAAATVPSPVVGHGSRAIAVTPVENPMRETAPGVYEGIVPIQLPDGSWRVDLDERFMMFSVMRRDSHGGLAPACVQGATGLSKWRASGAACDHAAAMTTPATTPATASATRARRPLVVSPEGSALTTWEVK